MIIFKFLNSLNGRHRKFLSAVFAVFTLLNFLPENLSAAAKNAHRFHSSLTRIDYDADEKNIKIAVQLITHDVLEVFEKIAGKSVELENSKEIDGLIQKYLAENFVLQDKNGKTLNIKWVGKETDFDRIFVYLEIPSDESIEGFRLKNTIFFETYPEQSNIVIAKFNGDKSDLLFVNKDGFKVIEKKEEKLKIIGK